MQESVQQLLEKIRDLENRLEESEQLIEAIKSGEVDAFAISNENESPEVYTLQSGDYAYRILIEEFGEGALNITEEGLIVYTNPYFFDLIKLPYEKVIGASLADFIHPDSQHQFNELLSESISGKSKGEINLLVKNTIIPVYISLTSLQPKLPTVGIIISDLTQKKKHESEILEYQENLETKNKELLKSNAELASFAYIASHDLQEPLRKIQSFSARILDKEAKNLSDTGKDYFNRMDNAAKRMRSLIEDLLLYSRTNTIERKFESIDLTSLIDELRTELKEDLQQKQAVIETTGICQVNVIPFQFRQLLMNLVSNSIKFSSLQRPLRIKIECKIETGVTNENPKSLPGSTFVHITIQDNGIGFDTQYSEKIFDLFQRLHGKEQYKGTGIGLSIVKKIVENHDGFIAAKGTLDQGATFDIYIPARTS